MPLSPSGRRPAWDSTDSAEDLASPRPKRVGTLGPYQGATQRRKLKRSRLATGPLVKSRYQGRCYIPGVLAAHDTDSDVRGQSPQISVRDEAGHILVCDRLQEAQGHVRQAGVGTKGALTTIGEAHGRVGATALQLAIREHASVVPGQADLGGRR